MLPQRSQHLRLYQNTLIAISGMSLLIPGIFVLKAMLTGSQWTPANESRLIYKIVFTFYRIYCHLRGQYCNGP
ncbi:hypothetical protein OKW21_003757 [Catalinimonas alkaloidigena]|uniref:hypothetical protein n=1 Tax=Catalinimonas alkaloidigena TaxID=1075417 RepID=UPI002404BE44|nr:hypothetical protein [Catalinimonas alkaloidigena]MDF9798494.1 hypothetical protein [Catalinimonas alkaloidigena]